MVCIFCARLFNFQQGILPYKPSNRLDLRDRQDLSNCQRLKFASQISDFIDFSSSRRPLVSVYRDKGELFETGDLWWQVPIDGDTLQEVGRGLSLSSSCRICELIFRDLSPSILYRLLQNPTKLEDRSCFVYRLRQICSSIPEGHEDLDRELVRFGGNRLSIWVEKQQQLLPLVQLNINPSPRLSALDTKLLPTDEQSVSTACPKTLVLAKNWLQMCNESKKPCWSLRRLDFRLPTRLIDVGPATGPPKPRLCISSNPYQRLRYMTLSYRWSQSPKVLLTQSTFHALRRCIPFEALPRSCQDAILITRYLGVRYLWIDALCIIQDSLQDWKTQSATMGDVYKFSYCTVAASSADSALTGCFTIRKPLKARLTRALNNALERPNMKRHLVGSADSERSKSGPSIDVSSSGSHSFRMAVTEDLILKPFQEDLWATEVDNSVLSHRAWAIQERMLSPRILHFTNDQVFWECRKTKACETWPQPIQSRKLEIRNVDKEYTTPSDDDSFSSCWSKIVKAYTKANLTHGSDKLVAIAGLVKEAIRQAQRLEVTLDYAAGLWKSTFIRDLLWYLEVPSLRTIENYRAPSWSWASVDGGVLYLFTDLNISPICTSLNINTISPDGSLNAPGQVASGYCRLRGSVIPTMGWKKSGRGFRMVVLPSDQGYLYEQYERSIELDYYPDVTPKSSIEKLVCFPVAEGRHKGESGPAQFSLYAGLVLEPADKSLNEYRRVGAFCEQKYGLRLDSITWAPETEITIL